MVKSSELTKEQGALVKRLLLVNTLLEERKLLYAEQDELIMKLKDQLTEVLIEPQDPEQKPFILALVDNFAESNVGWTQAAVKRWCMKIKKYKETKGGDHESK